MPPPPQPSTPVLSDWRNPGPFQLASDIDIALDRLVRSERLRQDLRGYAGVPPTPDEIALGELGVEFDLGDDDVDYNALYGGQ